LKKLQPLPQEKNKDANRRRKKIQKEKNKQDVKNVQRLDQTWEF